MAIFKANYVKRGKTAKSLAKASVRYIQHRRGKDGQTITRTLFSYDGAIERQDAYRMIDDAARGSLFYRFVLSPDPKLEDHNHDLDMRDIATQTMLALEERLGVPLQWLGAIHSDHAPHLHAHLIAIIPKRLYLEDLDILRQATTTAARQQRRILDLIQTHERETPYPLPSAAPNKPKTVTYPRYTGLKYITLGQSRFARRLAKLQQDHAFWHIRPRPLLPLYSCTCPQCHSLHVHNTRDPVHRCSCGLLLHRGKRLILSQPRIAFRQASPTYGWTRKGTGWQR